MRLTAVVKKGPLTWDNAALAGWLEEQDFFKADLGGEGAGAVKLLVSVPATMTGKAIMKLARDRLKPLCGGSDTVAAELFAALRVAAKEADTFAREQRAQMKEVGHGGLTGGAVGFARDAPSRPQIAQHTEAAAN